MSKDLCRPVVTVKLPVVSLKLEDLAYLRSLANPVESIRCHPKTSTVDKLKFLDLIANAKIPPTPEMVTQVTDEIVKLKAEMIAEIQADRFNHLDSYSIRTLQLQLIPQERTVLTEKGKELLASTGGDVLVKVRKVGCV